MPSGIAGTAMQREEWALGEPHGRALQARGLSVEMAARLGWRACEGPSDDLWVAIPYIDAGKRVGTKYRTVTGPKQFTQATGSQQIFYNIDCVRDPELAGFPLIITEGEMDALAAMQCGFPRTISVPGGAPDHDPGDDHKYWQYLAHAKDLLANLKPIVLAVDNDHNGTVLQEGLARRLGRSRCQIVEYPTGKDLGDVVAALGPQAVRLAVAEARYLPVPGLLKLSDFEERPPKRAHSTMIPGLDPHLRIRRGDFIVVTGPPGHGKSSFIANLTCNMGWHWRATSCIASFEQAVVPDMRRVLRSYRAECLEMHMSEEQKRTADQWIDERFIFLQAGESEEMTLSWLLERFAAAAVRHNAAICVIDPWNEVSIADRPPDWTTEQFVSQSLRLLKSFARTHDVAVIVVAHPRKLGRDRHGNIPKPGLWDIADSAAWANRCDAGVVIYRKDLQGDNLTEISIEKSRDYYAIGIPGTVTLSWQPETSRFVQPGRTDEWTPPTHRRR